MRASVELAAGLHKLTMYYVSGRKRYTAVAAWQPPGRKRIWPIGAKAFAPVARAAAGPMENYGQVVTIDFLPAHSGETFVAGRYYQRYTFEARVVGRGGRNISWHWDFGDRQSSDLPEAQHVYLRPGDYTVKLTARTYAGLLERTNKIHVSRPWDRVVVKKIDKVVRHGQIVAGYDFDRMRPAEIMHAVRILGRTEFSDAVLAAGDALLKRRKAGAHAVDWTMTEYTKVLLARRDVDQAVEALKKAETISATPHIAAKMLIRAGQILLKEKSDDRAALELFDLAISRYGPQVPAETVRDAHIGIADVWRLRGDYDRAMAAYPAAKPLRYRDPAKAAFRRGDFARHVIDYLRREEHKAAADQLDKWEHTFPADKLAGYTTLLRVLLLAATDMHSQAATRARALVKVNPSSNYAPRLLMLAAESYAAMGRTEDATAALKLVVSGYPESALAAEAAKKL